MLPNESLLQVVHFADYETFVLAKLSGQHFLRLVIQFAKELARRHRFHVALGTDLITCEDMTTGARLSIHYNPRNRYSLTAACREIGAVVGPHVVAQLTFYNSTWNMRGAGAVLEAAPPLKYAEDVGFNLADPTTGSCSEAFIRNFVGLKSLRLWINNDTVFRRFSWTFLRCGSARELRLIKFAKYSPATADLNSGVEALVRYCATLPHLLGGEPLKLDFSAINFSGELGLRIIELLKGSGREVIFRMRTFPDGGELMLDESEYAVDVDEATKRYTYKKNGIVVEVKGRSLTILSTAEAPPN